MSRRTPFAILLTVSLLFFFPHSLRAASPVWNADEWTVTLHELASDSFHLREAASQKLLALDIDALPTLIDYAKKTTDPEVKARLQSRIAELEGPQLTFEAEDPPPVKFGEPVIIKMTLINHRPDAVDWPAGSTNVACHEWSVLNTTGSGINRQGFPDDAQNSKGIPASGRLHFKFLTDELTTKSLGSGTARFTLDCREWSVQQRFGGQNQVTVRFEVVPTDFMQAVWSADTKDQIDKTQSQFNTLLLAADRNTNGPDTERFQTLLNWLGAYSVPYFETAAKGPNLDIRRQAFFWLPRLMWSSNELDNFLRLFGNSPRPAWAQKLSICGMRDIQICCVQTAIAGLHDSDPTVLSAVFSLLSQFSIRDGIPRATELLKNPDEKLRNVSLQYLARYTTEAPVARSLAALLSDPDPNTRETILNIFRGPFAPPPEIIRDAFQKYHDPISTALLPLLLEREDERLPDILAPGFADRSRAERFAILTALAGHSDQTTLKLLTLSLSDPNADVQRIALLRSLPFPAATALPLLAAYRTSAPTELLPLLDAVITEIHTRKIFPFLAGPVPLAEKSFPSQGGLAPLVSPDKKWIAYLETRPTPMRMVGRIGGPAVRNAAEVYTHIVKADGSDDRVISNMFPLAWLDDSQHVGSARDRFVAISDLNSVITAEFGASAASMPNTMGSTQTTAFLSHQVAQIKPNTPFAGYQTFSPDGKLFAAFSDASTILLLDRKNKAVEITLEQSPPSASLSFSPDDRFLLVASPFSCSVINIQTKELHSLHLNNHSNDRNTMNYYFPDSRNTPANPWSSDSQHFAYVNANQIWISTPDTQTTVQLTFDATQKANPVFSPDSTRIAYRTSQPNTYPLRPQPSDLWLLDIRTTLALRLTQPNFPAIHSLDWLSNQSLIFDRVANQFGRGGLNTSASLQTLSLNPPPQQPPSH